MRAIIASVILFLTACGNLSAEDYTRTVLGTFASILDGSPDITDAQIVGLGLLFREAYPWLNTDAVTIRVTATLEESLEVCGGDPACVLSTGEVVAPFDLDPGMFFPNDQSLWWGAFEMAHGLCHARFARIGAPDPDHNHAECYNDVATHVADAFVLRYGTAILRDARRR